MDCRPPGPPVHGIFWGWIVEWVAISFSRVSSRPRDGTQISCAKGSLLHCRQILCQLSHQRILLQYGRHGFYPWVGKSPWRREQLFIPVSWPGQFHGLCSPWGSQRVRHDWVTFTFTTLHSKGNNKQKDSLQNRRIYLQMKQLTRD